MRSRVALEPARRRGVGGVAPALGPPRSAAPVGAPALRRRRRRHRGRRAPGRRPARAALRARLPALARAAAPAPPPPRTDVGAVHHQAIPGHRGLRQSSRTAPSRACTRPTGCGSPCCRSPAAAPSSAAPTRGASCSGSSRPACGSSRCPWPGRASPSTSVVYPMTVGSLRQKAVMALASWSGWFLDDWHLKLSANEQHQHAVHFCRVLCY
ncbi:hypothetical protein BS78_01G468400 [Paspalum vaginatum]|nr:hypothetical protein BS78_01G468400 [Paspalum vaginatum]